MLSFLAQMTQPATQAIQSTQAGTPEQYDWSKSPYALFITPITVIIVGWVLGLYTNKQNVIAQYKSMVKQTKFQRFHETQQKVIIGLCKRIALAKEALTNSRYTLPGNPIDYRQLAWQAVGKLKVFYESYCVYLTKETAELTHKLVKELETLDYFISMAHQERQAKMTPDFEVIERIQKKADELLEILYQEFQKDFTDQFPTQG